MSVRTGWTPSGKLAETTPIASLSFFTSSAVPPSARNSFESVFWKGVSRSSAAGSHTRVTPEGFRTSTSVVTSNVRQAPPDPASAHARARFGIARLAETTPVDCRNLRRFMSHLTFVTVARNLHSGPGTIQTKMTDLETEVLILGAGLQGAGVALELARRGVAVTVVEQDEVACNRASLRNEGKIHLGFIYANDSSRATAFLQLEGALTFRAIVGRWLGADGGWLATSTRFHYLVANDSVLASGRARRALRGRRGALPGAARRGSFPGLPRDETRAPVRAAERRGALGPLRPRPVPRRVRHRGARDRHGSSRGVAAPGPRRPSAHHSPLWPHGPGDRAERRRFSGRGRRGLGSLARGRPPGGQRHVGEALRLRPAARPGPAGRSAPSSEIPRHRARAAGASRRAIGLDGPRPLWRRRDSARRNGVPLLVSLGASRLDPRSRSAAGVGRALPGRGGSGPRAPDFGRHPVRYRRLVHGNVPQRGGPGGCRRDRRDRAQRRPRRRKRAARSDADRRLVARRLPQRRSRQADDGAPVRRCAWPTMSRRSTRCAGDRGGRRTPRSGADPDLEGGRTSSRARSTRSPPRPAPASSS